jgi:hypothetical protein
LSIAAFDRGNVSLRRLVLEKADPRPREPELGLSGGE